MNILDRLRERFWFIPAVLCLGALVLAGGLVTLDERIRDQPLPVWVDFVVYKVAEDGSRDILGAIATSSLAVAGTTFSITMAVLALTSSTYGPRLVRNFMADRGNQLVLGVYVATFLYSLLVLRSVRAIDESGVFVPHLAVNVAGLLAILNVAVLVYFIHHISDSIQIATLAAEVRNDLVRVVDALYPEAIGEGPSAVGADEERGERPVEEILAGLTEPTAVVEAGRAGYLQFVRDDDLLKAATEHDVLVLLEAKPGAYVLADTAIALVHPARRSSEKLARKLREALVIADSRTPHQDVGFAVQQLTEMAVRALSPGTNDPFTAVNALNDLTVGLSRLAGRALPSAGRFDPDGALRVHAPRPDPVEIVSSVLDAMRWYAVKAPSVMHAALDLAQRVGMAARSAVMREQLRDQVSLMRTAFAAAGHHERDVRAFDQHAAAVARRLEPA